MNIRDTIQNAIGQIADEQGITIEKLHDDSVLLESGLDSLGFAILVAKLEEKLGYDPFTIMETAFYPRTFLDFVQIYEKFKPDIKLNNRS